MSSAHMHKSRGAPNLVAIGLVILLLALALAFGRIGELLWVLFPLGHFSKDVVLQQRRQILRYRVGIPVAIDKDVEKN